MPIVKHVSDTRHDIRFNVPSLGAVINDKIYTVNNLSLSGSLIALGDDIDSIIDIKEITICLISPDFGKGNVFNINCRVMDVSYETGLLRLSFTNISLTKKEILKYLLNSYKKLAYPDLRKLNKLFELDYVAIGDIVNKKEDVESKSSRNNLFFIIVFCISTILFFVNLIFYSAEKSEVIFSPSFAERVLMPINGDIDFLLPENNNSLTFVSKGAVVAKVIESNKTILLKSSCDCYVFKSGDNRRAVKGSIAFYLFSKASWVVVDILVPEKKLNELFIGKKIYLKAEGINKKIAAKITSIKYNISNAYGFALVKIRPDKDLPLDIIGKKAFVNL